MKLSIFAIQNQGVHDKEVIMLKVAEDCNLRNFIVTEAKISTEKVLSTSFTNTFWFQPKDVKKGDYVMLYSRPGTDSDSANELGSRSHICHWKSDHPIWESTEDSAVVFEIANWVSEPTRSFVSSV